MSDLYEALCFLLYKTETVKQAEYVADRAGEFAERLLKLQDLARRRMDELIEHAAAQGLTDEERQFLDEKASGVIPVSTSWHEWRSKRRAETPRRVS